MLKMQTALLQPLPINVNRNLRFCAPSAVRRPASEMTFTNLRLLASSCTNLHKNLLHRNCNCFKAPRGPRVVRRCPSRYTPRMAKTLFERIGDGEIPAQIVYQDDKVLAFRDIKPGAPTLVLIVPRKPIPRIAEARPEDHQVLGHLLLKAAQVAEQLGLKETGYRLVINNGPDASESVPHLHMHILGGRKMSWPPG